MLLQNVYVPLGNHGTFTDVQVTHSIGINTLPYQERRWLLNIVLVTIGDHNVHYFPKPIWKVDSSDNLSVYLRWALAQRSRWRFWMLLIYGFTLRSRVLTCICGCSNKLCLLTRVYSKVYKSLCGYIHYRSILVFSAVLSEGSKVKDVHYWFSALYAQRYLWIVWVF